MKRISVFILLLALLCLSGCVNEFPEPTYVPPLENPERHLVNGDVVNSIEYSLYSDMTCEISGVDDDFTGTTLDIPEYYENYRVIAIQDEAFKGLKVTDVVLPITLETIGDRAFQQSGIREVTLPESLVSIGKDAFDNCLNLTRVTFSSRMTAIPTGAFYSCTKLEEILLPDGIQSVGEEAFAGCSAVKKIRLPSSLSHVGAWAFWNCGAADAQWEVSAQFKSVEADAFSNTAWLKAKTEEWVVVGDGVLLRYRGTASQVTVPAEVKYLSNAFDGSNATTVTLPDTLQGLCQDAFAGSSVTQVIYLGNNESIRALLP